ncbi:bifunctional folylpolyglutamate synthase/dihydrofolate synthase [Isobaculum melis]|uniref:Dihydrofolate synthase/folylpolyglutamate synthase n=1 Tax=Isobaculum melis TaxID=142588 RepID=A0A1H9RG62_9LACT|nr:folylpolyglutamate synthase/dihydrofolate synthase family protein [Isobaculum melis]SER71790.1 dihydrofolate synthase / folylpolyglutamate synthase [Isobaculum melis]
MFNTYEEALSWLHSGLKFGMKLGLERMGWLMKKLDHPQKKIKAIHVAGTNGKGSTVAFIRHILEETGLSVGTFTSPFLESFNERISIDGEPISDAEVLRLVNLIYPLCMELAETDLGSPTEFEVVTAMMYAYFGEGHADVVLVEVGIGGQLDSTNVLTPVVSVITTIGLDHMDILGNTLPKIAQQKSGIIKPGVPVVVGKVTDDAFESITQTAQETGSKVYRLGTSFTISKWQTTPNWGEQFNFEDDDIFLKQQQIQMLGRHQVENAAVAIEAVKQFSHTLGLAVSHSQITKGLKQTFWAGRMEKISDRPFIVLDGAHNKPAVTALVQTLKDDFKGQPIQVLFAALKDKEISEMLDLFATVPELTLTATSFEYPRAASAEEIAAQTSHSIEVIDDWKTALATLLNEVGSEGILLITGSLYFISEVRRLFFDQ